MESLHSHTLRDQASPQITKGRLSVQMEMLSMRMELLQKMMSELKIAVTEVKTTVNELESNKSSTERNSQQQYLNTHKSLKGDQPQVDVSSPGFGTLSKQLKRENQQELPKNLWPEIDWSIIKSFLTRIELLPQMNWTEKVYTLSEEAYKACANCIFNCFNCKTVVRGCNLARCKNGHLLCEDCLQDLDVTPDCGRFQYLCKCKQPLMDAYGDSNEKIVGRWGFGVRRRIGRKRALVEDDFMLTGHHLDCK